MFGRSSVILDNHIKDCERERERMKEWRIGFESKLDIYHGENRSSIRGIYRILWSTLGGVIILLISVLGWILSNSVSLGLKVHG